MRQSVVKKDNVPCFAAAFRGCLLSEQIKVFFVGISFVTPVLR